VVENQHNKNISKELSGFRAQIDQIDSDIIELLSKRIKIVAAVGKHKELVNDKFFIRSNREADMIKSLVQRADKAFPPSVIVTIWRKIITSANVLEQDLKIAIHNPAKLGSYHHLIREYYGDFVPLVDCSSSTSIMDDIEKNNIQIGVFALPSQNCQNKDLDHWWINIANNKSDLKVFAKIPFIEYKKDENMIQDNLVVVTAKDAEQSKSDKTLLTIELENSLSAHSLKKALLAVNLDAKIIKEAKIRQINNITFYLVEVDGFYKQGDDVINILSKNEIKPHVKVIGNYPTPIKL
jgi:chorismate mutase